jgi:regulatory protein
VAEAGSRTDAREVALRALRQRDRSVRELDRRLSDRGFDEDERAEALEGLIRTGLVDDARFAEGRARSLARRGAGDALIRHALRMAGVSREDAETALGAVEPESSRAREIVARRGPGPATARYLRTKGFSDEVASAIAAEADGELG